MKIFHSILIIISTSLFLLANLYSQMIGRHGDYTEVRKGLHAGNQFRTTFYNDGTFGAITTGDIGGEWPINSGHIYLTDGNIFVGSEVIDNNNILQHIFSTVMSSGKGNSTGDTSPSGEWWTFLPLGGFANPTEDKIAMSKWSPKDPTTPNSWPDYWPDIADPENPIYSPDGWAGSWNGYFGRDVFNADEESYFVADDYQNKEFAFYPDTTDMLRGGLGIRMYVRGFQWSSILVSDALFILFDLKNIATHHHNKMVFGYKIGNNMGSTISGLSDGQDDCGAFDKEQDIAYLYDADDIGGGGWQVGYFGGAFLESPGDPYDGIDNDGDGKNGTGSIISEAMFTPRILSGEVILVDYTTFERTNVDIGDLTSQQLPQGWKLIEGGNIDTIGLTYLGYEYKFWSGKEVEEVPFNLIDDNLNGIIDENNGVTFGDPPITTYLYTGEGVTIRYIDYYTNAGSDNILIDERRDDGIDNDGDWDAEFDDLGMDGAPFTHDEGEGNGIPTIGEPHFEKTDIDESDMIGLTNFTLYKWETMAQYEDEKVWQNTRPGLFDNILTYENVELLYGSGYFPMKAGQTERFSMSLICGIDLLNFLENKKWVDLAYHANYNFSKAPLIPNMYAVAGNNRVTLYWDDRAEDSVDPVTGKDFEGYCIYRSTDPGWNDMPALTDYYGTPTAIRRPLAQFDIKDNGFDGPATVDIRGVHFYLGDNTGLVHSFIDTTAKNGYTYYYAVTSYDHGDPADTVLIPPTECSKFISISTSGVIDKGPNVVIVRPAAAAAGFVPADFDSAKIKKSTSTTTDCIVGYDIIEPADIKDNHTYQITFEDSIVSGPVRYYTKNFTLTDITENKVVLEKCKCFHTSDEVPITDGFKLKFNNNPDSLTVNEFLSGWNRTDIHTFSLEPNYTPGVPVKLISADFEIIIGDVGIDTSVALQLGTTSLEAMPVNFTIRNTTLNKKAKFAFRDSDFKEGEEGMLTFQSASPRGDYIVFLTDSLDVSWRLKIIKGAGTTSQPGIGDVLTIKLNKPLLSTDLFEFTTHTASINNELAKEQLDLIKVVPNPYIVTNSWEPSNPYANGRGPRELHFTHLPSRCTIKIFNIRGQLVRELEHNEPGNNGTEVWDMLTRDNLDIAYGVYIYHVKAKGIGEKIGKFAVIK